MLLHANKKQFPQDISKNSKKQRAKIASIAKPKHKIQDPPSLRIHSDHIAILDSLEVRCEGMKLNARDSRSPERRRITGKVLRTDTLIRPILLTNFHLPRSSSLIHYNQSFLPLLSQFSENPEQLKLRRTAPTIPTTHLLLLHQSKYVELKERTAFYLPDHTYAGLHLWEQKGMMPKSAGLLASWGVCLMGNDKKKYHVSELYFGYSFRNLMSQFGKFEECTARLFLRQLVSTVNRLHLDGHCHNRLTLDSICHDCQGHLLVNYFKSSSLLLDQTERQSYMYYFSPELLLARMGGHDNKKNDIWAIGCIALQFMSSRSIRTNKRHPYNWILYADRQGKPSVLAEKLKKIIQKKMENTDIRYEDQERSKEANDFINCCLQLKEEKRASASQLLSHPFLKE